MDTQSALQYLHGGKVLAVTIPAGNTNHFAWVGVYHLDLSKPTTVEFLRNEGLAILPSVQHAYHIRHFEVERSLVESDACIAEPEMTSKRSLFAFGDNELVTVLAELGVQIEQLDLPYKSNYPI
jgi:hypothetical protein